MKHFGFYAVHAIRDMLRNGRRTAFALFCVAAGVAAIVSLRSLSLMIADSLAGNLGSINHGDMRVMLREEAFSLSNSNDGRQTITAEQLTAIKKWAEINGLQYTEVISDANIQVAPLNNQQNVGRPQWISSYVIDPAVYPFYGPVVALDPPGVPLAKLFTGGNDVVISKNLADNNQIKVGDQVRVGRTTELFTVRGIVDTEAEGSLRNIFASFFGFAYFDKAQMKTLQLDALPSEVYLLAPRGADVNALEKSLGDVVPGLSTVTINDVRRQNSTIADMVDRLIMVMGLAALLIGSTGIIHTMLVVVNRRTVEIAVLKTLGLKGRQITLMFLVEAAIMGVVGSLLGVLLGIVFSVGVLSFMQGIWPQALAWRFYPEAMLTGMVLGILITTVFGFLPTLTAGAVRPAVVLRPNDVQLPATGCLSTALTVLLLVAAVGLIAGQLIGNLLVGLIGIAVAGIGMGITVGLLYLLILIVSKLPAFGSVDLRIALRGIGMHRVRTASTLLALVGGILSLSVITLMADSIPRLLNLQFSSVLGGNVMVFVPVPALQRPFVNAQLSRSPGVQHYTQVGLYSGKLEAINGDRNWDTKLKPPTTFGGTDSSNFGGPERRMNSSAFYKNALGSISTLNVASKGYQAPPVTQGRALNAEDAGKPVVVMQLNNFSELTGIKLGDELTFSLGSKEVTFTVAGISDLRQQAQSSGAFSLSTMGAFSAPVDSFPAGVTPTFEFTVARVDEAGLNQTLVNISTVPGVLVLDISFIESLLKRTLEQFTAIPTIVAVLSLFAGAVIIANTVSLATLERRRQVGIMKAIGLRGRRVLAQMVLENGLIGLLGGVIGVGIGVALTLLFTYGSDIPITTSISWGIVFVLVGLSLLISLVATLLSAWTAASEKPLHVLRYE